MQLLLLFLGIFIPLNKSLFLYAALTGHWKGPVAAPTVMAADLATDVLMTLAAWTSFLLIRAGCFRRALHIFLGVVMISMAVAYVTTGIVQLPFDPMPMILLALAGLVLGQRALWVTFFSLVAVLSATLMADVLRASPSSATPPIPGFGKAVSLSGIWLILAIIFDQTVAALRNSLEESDAHGQALELAYDRLQEEINKRERAEDQLVHAQKMEAIGRLASGVAHDFNNVLGIILGQATQRDRLADKGSDALHEALGNVEIAAKRALAISRKLLNFSRQEAVQLEDLEVGAALSELVPMLKQLFGSRVCLQLELPDDTLLVRMDAGRFALIVINIAANARDAIGDIGTFRIQVDEKDGKWICLTLTDDGRGMSEEVRARAFEPFFTTKPSWMGTGLGLSVVRDMVMEAEGTIELESWPERGTLVRILLPIADPLSKRPASTGTSAIAWPERPWTS